MNPAVETAQEPVQKIPEERDENMGENVEVPKMREEALVEVSAEVAPGDETLVAGESLPDLINKGNEPVAIEKQIRSKRRRKLLIDEVKEIDSNTMKNQLSDTSGIVSQLELAPPTRRLMHLKETSSVEKMFSSTSRPLHSKSLHKVKNKYSLQI